MLFFPLIQATGKEPSSFLKSLNRAARWHRPILFNYDLQFSLKKYLSFFLLFQLIIVSHRQRLNLHTVVQQ